MHTHMSCISLEMIHVHLFVMFVDAHTLHFISHVIECSLRRFSVMYIMMFIDMIDQFSCIMGIGFRINR